MVRTRSCARDWSTCQNRKTLPPDAAQVDDPAIMRADRDFKSEGAAPGVVDEKPPTTIHASNIAETATSQDAFAVSACNGPTIVEAGAYMQVDRDGVCRRRQNRRRCKA
jgi:hypothetical protein